MSEKNENSLSDIAQVRDIIFGSQIKIFEDKIELLETQITELKNELKTQKEDKVSKETLSKLLFDMSKAIEDDDKDR
ncbi:MAG: hypothetical protein QM493_01635 [Sulfurovum sp.]